MEVEVRAASALDRERVAAFLREQGYPHLIDEQDRHFIAERERQVIAAVRLSRAQSALVLRGMRVRKDCQRQGVGRRLLALVAREIDAEPCYCLPYSWLVSFYGEAGFSRISAEEAPAFLAARYARYVAGGQDVIVMRRSSAGTLASEEAAAFNDYHGTALQRDEIRNGLILGLMARAVKEKAADIAYWSLGRPGACAIKTGNRSIVLGALDRAECRNLAELTAHLRYPGVVGLELTASWFCERARELGAHFGEPVPQQLWSLSEPPRYPGAEGFAHPVTSEHTALAVQWLIAFLREAVPGDPMPERAELERLAGDGRFLLWIDGGRPVSIAGITRRLKSSATIAPVYTPPELRCRGYAGSVTAATVERIYAEGHRTACLYTDLRNPASNRCYANVGFRPVCEALHFYRRLEPDAAAADVRGNRTSLAVQRHDDDARQAERAESRT